MKESFLHYVWQFQKFDASNLKDADGNDLVVLSVGEHNTNAGPDFLNATVKIGDITWHGQVEIHINSNAWNQHKHQHDPAYENVILHVVWENGSSILHPDGKKIPTITLKNRISESLLLQSNQLLESPEKIPCAQLIHKTNDMTVFSMLEKSAIERLETKSKVIFELFKQNKGDWEETAYQLLAQNFGFKINAHPFLKLSKKLPYKVLKKHCGQVVQIEALLYGVSGFLNEEPKDDYHSSLMNEYVFLSRKYKLEGLELNKSEWKYLRLRPANFPTVRLAQFAALINQSPRLFDVFKSFESTKKLISQLKHKPSNYWVNQYDFGKKSKQKLLGIGSSSLEIILINTAAPLLLAYGKYTQDEAYIDKSINLLQSLKAENNHILDQWKSLSISANNAFESQALIELYNNYCLNKKCLSCNIGVSIIGHS